MPVAKILLIILQVRKKEATLMCLLQFAIITSLSVACTASSAYRGLSLSGSKRRIEEIWLQKPKRSRGFLSAAAVYCPVVNVHPIIIFAPS